MEDGVLVGERVVAGVVAEGALEAGLALLDVALEDDLGVGGHLEVDGRARRELDRLAAQEAGEHELADAGRQRRRRGVRDHRVGAEGDGDLEPAVGLAEVGGAVVVDVPVHAGRSAVEDLQPVHAGVAAALAVLGDDDGQRDEGAAVAAARS